MTLRDLFISEDKRRGKSRLTLLSWIVIVVVAAMSVGAIAVGVRSIRASASVETMRPVATAPAEMAAVESTRPPTGLAADEGCPADPSRWSLAPYQMPASDRPLYKIHPVCVMEQVEETFKEYLEAVQGAGRDWSAADEEHFYTPSGFTKPLTGENTADFTQRTRMCFESTDREGEESAATARVVFYTAGQEGLVADVMFVSRPEGPFVSREYDCETGELIAESVRDGTQGFVAYWPMLYEEGRWRLGYQADVYHELPSDELDPHAMADTVLMAQGRASEIQGEEE